MTSNAKSAADDSLPERIARKLVAAERDLGIARHKGLSPELTYGRHYGPAAHNARRAAVVILLYPHEGVWQIPLMVRPTGSDAHAGQVCLPGGVVESGESLEEGALRELHEEFGIPDTQLRVLGQLSSIYVFVSNYLVTPFVATAAQRPQFSLNPAEVAQLLEVPLGHLLDPENRQLHNICRRGLEFQAPHILWQEHKIWGATLSMLGEMLDLANSVDATS